jgi:hypothetical protein
MLAWPEMGAESRRTDFPLWESACFADLKRSYTELHSDLTARTPSESPALCLGKSG